MSVFFSIYYSSEKYAFLVFGREAAVFDAQTKELLPANGGDGSLGFRIQPVCPGVTVERVRRAGDANADGIDDLLITGGAADCADSSQAKESYVVFGHTGGFPATLDPTALRPESGGDGSEGFVVGGSHSEATAARDVNGDGSAGVVLHECGSDVSAAGDIDGDGADNCLLAANADQRDTDNDGFGNLCDAEFNNDCLVNFIDLGAFRQNFLIQGDTVFDLNGDGVANFLDPGLVRAQFFDPPGPAAPPTDCDP